MSPASLAREARVVVCLGGGGVGKTTVAAAIAHDAACAGRRALVMTVDPARRLADALGLAALGDEPHPVPGAPGLEALMLDQRRAWERLVARHAPTPVAAARLRENRFYRALSAQFAGTHEYLAVEALCAAVEAGHHDLIVLDTPPVAHALEFLAAPARLRGLVDRRLLRWLAPSSAGGGLVARLAGRTTRFLVDELEEATGATALAEIGDFFVALGAFVDVLVARARALEALLRDHRTAIVLVAGPDARGAGEARASLAQLARLGLPLAALVVNRAHLASGEPVPPRDELVHTLAAAGADAPLAAWLADTYLGHRALAAGEAAERAGLRAELPPGARLVVVPSLEGDVHDLSGLAELARRLAPG